jgi:hypothetical protein
MVSPEVTQPSNTPLPRRDASVRITAIRRQGITDFLTDALTVQRAVAEGERIDREATACTAPTGFFTTADLRVSNAAAVQQWIASNLAAYTDNRDFPAVTK